MWDHINNVKPRDFFYTLKYAIPYMKKQKYGLIILCASPAFTGGPLKQAAYVTANAGVVGLTRAVAMECIADGITANCFAPGALTRATYELEAARDSYDKGILIEGRSFIDAKSTPGPEYVAPFVVYLASEKSSRINGSTFMLYGNLVGMFANPVFEKTLKKDSNEPWGWMNCLKRSKARSSPVTGVLPILTETIKTKRRLHPDPWRRTIRSGNFYEIAAQCVGADYIIDPRS